MKFGKLFIVLFILTISTEGMVVLANEGQSHDGVTLTFSHDNTPGLSHRDGSGAHDKIVREMCRRARITCKFVFFDLSVQALRQSNAGQLDGAYPFFAVVEETFLNLRPVPESIDERKFVAFARADTKIAKVEWSHVCDLHPAFPRGWEALRQGLGHCETHFTVPDPTELFELLLEHKAGIVVAEVEGGQHILKTKGLSGIRMLEPPFSVDEVFVYLHQKHSPTLTERLAKALREIKEEGNQN